jgi:hypothetical protein
VVYAGRVLGTMNLLGRQRVTTRKAIRRRSSRSPRLMIGPFLDAIAADPDIGSK